MTNHYAIFLLEKPLAVKLTSCRSLQKIGRYLGFVVFFSVFQLSGSLACSVEKHKIVIAVLFHGVKVVVSPEDEEDEE